MAPEQEHGHHQQGMHVDQRYKDRTGGLPQFLFIDLQPNKITECNNYKALNEYEASSS